ncbi:MAG TPA: ATP-binding protein [Williamwhitmania sp.]|nr:ATP-binding protein [Williamwhitmania sp.]
MTERTTQLKIAIASGKGGTGKTFVSTNMFRSLQQYGSNVVLVDCDAEAPNSVAFFQAKEVARQVVKQLVPVIDTKACTFCGRCHDWCSYNAIFILPPAKVIQVIDDLCHGCGACSVACKANAISEKPVSLGEVASYTTDEGYQIIEANMAVGVMSPVSLIKAAIANIPAEADLAILDSPPGTSCPFVQTASAADYVVLVTEPTPFGLSDLKQSVNTLKEIGKPFGVIVNRAGLGNRDIYTYLKEEKIELLLEIPYDAHIAEVYSRGELIVNTMPNIGMQLNNVVTKIIRKHGSSGNKR